MGYPDLKSLKQHLNELIANASFWPDENETLEAAQQHFLAAGPEICAPLTELLWNHYEGLAPMWAMEANELTRVAEQVPSLSEPSQVWAHVDLKYPPEILESQESAATVSIPFQVDVAWYRGHGLTVTFDYGTESDRWRCELAS